MNAKESVTPETVHVVRAADLASAKLPLTPMAPRFATKENSQFVQGRRDWLQYLDAGLAEASGGRVRATLSTATGAMVTETGWHYHECEMQIGFITKGWIELQFEDGTEVRLEGGDILFVPGGVKHNELRTSDDIAGLEITIPADMGTVACDKPEGWKPKTVAALS
ncbi:MAG: cupin domain-containing protein [Acidimicrobiales bacterium]